MMEDARNVLGTSKRIVNAIFVPLSHLTPALGAVAMFGFNLFFNIIVPSGSGQVAVVMPLMTPLADMLGLTRQTAVVAFKLGDGITNMITLVSGVLMAVLAMDGAVYEVGKVYAAFCGNLVGDRYYFHCHCGTDWVWAFLIKNRGCSVIDFVHERRNEFYSGQV